MKLDLDDESRRALEWDAVLALLASHAATVVGAERIRRSQPSADPEWIASETARVAEAALHLAEMGRLVSGGIPDPTQALAVLPVEGARVGAPEMLALAGLLLASSDLRARLLDLDPDSFPLLRTLGGSIPDLRAEAKPIARGILPDGRLADGASPELARIRAALARVGEKLRRMLESLVRDPSSDAVIRDDFVTQRNGRFVVPVRSDAPRPVRGIVHAASSSGATLFVEPLESVEWNNELVRLSEAEQEEQERVLLRWSSSLRERIGDVRKAVDGLAAVDSLQARARFAAAAEAVPPVVAPGAPVDLEEVRHPLLDHRLREGGFRAVAADVRMGAGDRVLVLSGPNTGGKTVALKTIGLAVLMAQSGIPVCAARARLPVFSQVRADIGDHQSIDADLSTFSAHVRAVAAFLREARPPALFLFDEIGSGTDPAEGSALARAILERLLAQGFTTVATTHQGALKAWAFTTPGAASAALEFDAEALRPTYRILAGAAGASAGVDIAARLGLEPALVERARQHLGDGSVQAEEYMRRLREISAEVEGLRDDLSRRQAELAAERERVAGQAAKEKERRRAEASAALEAVLREFHEEGRRELAAIDDLRERAKRKAERERAERRLRAEATRRTEQLSAGDGLAIAAEPLLDDEPAPGEAVLVYSLGKVGEVVAVRGSRSDVRLGAMVFTVATSDLRKAPAGGEAKARPAPARAAAAVAKAQPPRPAVNDLLSSDSEILLIGKRVEEALEEIDRRLDAAARAGFTSLRIVHGHGSGRLRSGVRRFLTGHPHVESHRPGSEHEGGDGATIVILK